ncbi:MAG: hypothetical protein AAGF71_12885 [Pseudomonadota bacterium]
MEQVFEIFVPWPPSVLWPNRNAHWSKKTGPRKKQKNDTYFAALEVRVPRTADAVNLDVIGHKPSSVSRYDRDNPLAAMKGAIDTVATMVGVDDSKFSPKPYDDRDTDAPPTNPPLKPGKHRHGGVTLRLTVETHQ